MSDTTAADPENTLIIEIEHGTITIALRPDLAPKHVEQIKTLARRGFYNDTPFHRVIEGFMAQGGDPTGTGTGGSDLPDIEAERRVLVGFKLSDLYAETFTYQNGEKQGQTGVSLKTRLLRIDWAKVEGEYVVRPKAREETQGRQGREQATA